MTDPDIAAVDAFDLPEWVGVDEVTWHADPGTRFGHHITGRLTAEGREPVGCDLLAIDQAYPYQVADSGGRRQAHQAWHHGQVLLVMYDGRLTLGVPGHEFSADLVLAALARLAKAVGARPERFVAAIRIGCVGRTR